MKSEWVEINLLWKVNIYLPDPPPPPVDLINQKVKEYFGFTNQELQNNFVDKWDLSDEVEWQFQLEELTEINDPRMIVVEYRAMQDQQNLIDDFVETLPEVILWNRECDQVREQQKEAEAKACFIYSPLNHPGVLIEVWDGETAEDGSKITTRHLIGDINHIAGVCDDCTAFEDDAIVLRAMVLISEEELKAAKYGT